MSQIKTSSFQFSDNECYSTIDSVPSTTLAAKAPVPVKKDKMKCYMVAIVMATILNFLLVIGLGATLFYFQTDLAAKVDQLTQDNGGLSGIAGTYKSRVFESSETIKCLDIETQA